MSGAVCGTNLCSQNDVFFCNIHPGNKRPNADLKLFSERICAWEWCR